MRISAACASILAVLLLLKAAPALRAGGGPQNVLLLVNERSTESVEVAGHYARARGLHPINVLCVNVATDLTIPFDTYEDAIAGPLSQHLERSGLGPQIDYIVTTQGFPIRLSLPPGSGQRQLSLTAALQGLGTDLAALPSTPAGRLNPYFGIQRAFSHEEALAGGKVKIRLATMLAGFNAADALKLIDNALLAEAAPPPNGLFLFQDARGNAKTRNEMYVQALTLLEAENLAARHIGPGPGALAELPPLICWFSGGSYSGLTRESIRALSFRPGAIVDMLQSFGAVPANFQDGGKQQQVPITWAVEAGATGVHGAVAEPFTVAFPDPGTALLYARGFNMAESFFQRIRTFWWQNLLLGDPLCAPFARPPAFSTNLDELVPGPIGGTLKITVEGDSLAGSELFLDGIRTARARRGEALVWNTLSHPDGPVHVRVTVFGDTSARTQAHKLADIQVFNPSFRSLGFCVEGGKPAAGPSDGLILSFSRAPALPAPAGAVVLLGPNGEKPAFDLREGPTPNRLRLQPRAPLSASTSYSISVNQLLQDRGGQPLQAALEGTFRTTAAGIALRGPASVKAGSRARFELLALAGAGPDAPHDSGFSGSVRLKPGDPAAEEPGTIPLVEGRGAASLLFRTAGEWEIQFEDPVSGLKGCARVVVEPAAHARVELLAPKEWPAGHILPATLVGKDAFGNETPAPSPPLTVSLGSSLPVTTALAGESRTTLLLHAPWSEGEVELLVRKGDEQAGKTSVKLTGGPLRNWLRLGPFTPRAGARPEPPDPPRSFPEAGLVHAGEPWLPEESKETPSPLPWLRENRSGWLALPFQAFSRQTLELRLGLAGASCTVFLNGRKLAHTPPTESLTEALTLKLPLTPGPNWLGLALSRPGPAAPLVQIQLCAEKGGPPDLCLSPHHPLQPPERFTVTGQVRVGSQALAGLRVELSGPAGKAVARTEENGFFELPGLASGRYTLRPLAAELAFQPPLRELLLAEGHLWKQDFEAVDDQPPTLKVLSPRPGSAHKKRLRVQVQAADNLGLAEIRFFIDDKEVGAPLKPPASRTELPIDGFERGRHTLTVLARDHAGNETKVKVEVVF